MQWRDTPARYGLVSRALHWSMALLFLWQFAGMGIRLAIGRSPVTAFMVGSHASVGTLLFALALARGAWGLVNLRRRHHEAGPLGRVARLGHLALYGLMLTVPALALLRHYGSGRALAPFGLPLLPGSGERIEALMLPGDLAHGLLAWVLLAAVAGHVGMVLVHHFVWRDGTWPRMGARRAGSHAPVATGAAPR